MKPHSLAHSAAGHLPAHVLPVIIALRSTVRRISELMMCPPGADPDQRTEPIRQAADLLAQISAALVVAGLDDVAALPRLMQRALLPVVRATAPLSLPSLSPPLAQAIGRSLSALLCHFNAYATTAARTLPALRLYPAYRDLAILLGEGPVSPAALLSLHSDATVPMDMTAYRLAPDGNQRQQFEHALLDYLRAQSSDARFGAAVRIAAVIGDIALRQRDANAQRYWQVLVAFAELASNDASVDINAAKKIFSGAARLVRHPGNADAGMPPPMLVRDALVEISRATSPTALARTIRLVFRLEQQMVTDFGIDHYCPAEPAALATLSAALASSKRALDAAGPDTPSPLTPHLQALANAMAAIPAFAALSAALHRIAEQRHEKILSQHHALQLAVCLLHIERLATEPDELVAMFASEPTLLLDMLASMNAMVFQPGSPPATAQERAEPAVFPAACRVQWRSAAVALKATLIQTLAWVETRLNDELASAEGTLPEAMLALNNRLGQVFSALHFLGEQDAANCAKQLRALLPERLHDDRTDAASCAAMASQFVQLVTLVEAIPCTHPPAATPDRPVDPDPAPTVFSVSATLAAITPDLPLPPTSSLDDVPQNPTQTSPQTPPLLMIYLDEAQQLIAQLDWHLSGWIDAPPSPLPTLALHAAHSLAGSSATVGAQSLHEFAAALEEVLQQFAQSGAPAPDLLRHLLPEMIHCLETMLAQLARHEARHEAPSPETALLNKLAALKPAARPPIPDPDACGTEAACVVPVWLPEGGADTGVEAGQPLLQALWPDSWAEHQVAQEITSPAEQQDELQSAQQRAQQRAQAALPVSAPEQDCALEREGNAAVDSAVDAAAGAVVDAMADVAGAMADIAADAAVDAELLAIFIDEAADLLPQLGQQLRAWHEAPADNAPAASLLRLLHTLKGSARMAGAMDLGQRLHELEHAVTILVPVDTLAATAIDALLTDLDGVLHAYFMLTQAARPPDIHDAHDAHDVPASIKDTDAHPLPVAQVQAETAPACEAPALAIPLPVRLASPVKPASPSLQLRVRADLLDRISSDAAELVVGSARIGSELQQQRHAMSELTANMARLRSQLRELEMQAETSIASQLAPTAATREFDPLEFDRFTRLQELSRMMAESMADVLSLQRSIARHADAAELAMAAQLRHARALQSDFRRVRVVAFSHTAERLHHLVRQLARDLGRHVRLAIIGGELELDRGMLEKLSTPLEHLLRNAVVHGIEAPAQRLAAGKSEQACVQITLSQQGNDVVLQLADDGRGLDLARIREQAIIAGLLASDARPTEAELIDCIFAPGLTTARELTEIAGRGIGMDAVRACVLGQGGTLTVRSQAGKGTGFTIVLPLTLATVQVVLVRAGLHHIALQATQVQQVLQLAPAQANRARTAGIIEWRGQALRLYRLEALLVPAAAMPPARPAMPAVFVILRQLDHFIALELDAVTGNREIVIKNLGAQLASVPGMAGATMLADTSIVLIINPFALLAAKRTAAADYSSGTALSADLTAAALPPASMVMVVDDSLTMRRVSQRTLERHGYATTLARDGLDALEKLHAMAPPAAILLDIEMPRMDGFDLLRNLRLDPDLRRVPVVMITSRTASRHREHAMQLGANAYLGKPYRESELLDVLTQVCGVEHGSHGATKTEAVTASAEQIAPAIFSDT